jgi:hypothetical protein
MATAVAKAVAVAEWPDGNACDFGMSQRTRAWGTRSRMGRLRRKACLPARLATGLAAEMPMTPRRAARRRCGLPVSPNAAAVPNHRSELSATRESLGRTASNPGKWAAATASKARLSSLFSLRVSDMRPVIPGELDMMPRKITDQALHVEERT